MAPWLFLSIGSSHAQVLVAPSTQGEARPMTLSGGCVSPNIATPRHTVVGNTGSIGAWQYSAIPHSSDLSLTPHQRGFGSDMWHSGSLRQGSHMWLNSPTLGGDGSDLWRSRPEPPGIEVVGLAPWPTMARWLSSPSPAGRDGLGTVESRTLSQSRCLAPAGWF